jgi:hypothetical protein
MLSMDIDALCAAAIDYERLPLQPRDRQTGDRYLGDECWEHHLAFGLYRPSAKRIKISMKSTRTQDRFLPSRKFSSSVAIPVHPASKFFRA